MGTPGFDVVDLGILACRERCSTRKIRIKTYVATLHLSGALLTLLLALLLELSL